MKYLIVYLAVFGAVYGKPSAEYASLFESSMVEARGLSTEMDDFFKLFVKEEMEEYVNNLPPALARSVGFLNRIPCVDCMRKYLQCKRVCHQLVVDMSVFFYDQFACFLVCWQKVISCCIVTSRQKIFTKEVNITVSKEVRKSEVRNNTAGGVTNLATP